MSENKEFVAKINDILTKMLFYSGATLSSIFIVGNVLNILICTRKTLIEEMIGFYNIIVSVFNIITIIMLNLIVFPTTLNYQDLTTFSIFSCISIMYFTRVSAQMSSWLYVFLSLDRYLCVVNFKKLKSILKDKKKISLILLTLFVTTLVINSPNFLLSLANVSAFDSQTNQTQVSIVCTATSSILLTRNMIVIVFRIVLPLILQIIFSVLLIYKLFKTRESVAAGIDRNMKKEYRFARIIIWLNICFIITQTPFMIATIYFSVLGVRAVYPISETASNSLAISSLVFFMTNVFSSYMFGSLFFVNLLTNRIFKNEVRLIFRCGPIDTQTSILQSNNRSNLAVTTN
jgi:hypothetical protein